MDQALVVDDHAELLQTAELAVQNSIPAQNTISS
jgi:hypothetical protein